MEDRTIRDLIFEEVRDGLADGTLLLVDVREDREHAAGMIPGSVPMPLSRFDPSQLPEGAGRIAFSCAAGVRSRQAAEICRLFGLPHGEHYLGGYKDWLARGGPVTTPSSGRS